MSAKEQRELPNLIIKTHILQWRSKALTRASLLPKTISIPPNQIPSLAPSLPPKDPTHNLRFDRMLISTCEWLRTAVCSSDSGPLLISQFSCRSGQHQAHLLSPLPVMGNNIPAAQSHTLCHLPSIHRSAFPSIASFPKSEHAPNTHVHSFRGFCSSALSIQCQQNPSQRPA